MKYLYLLICLVGLSACSSNVLPTAKITPPSMAEDGSYEYRISPGDTISVFVWRNADLSGDYQVRPDGKISMALTNTILAAGKTNEELAQEITTALSKYIKTPKVTIMIKHIVGSAQEQVRIIGDAGRPISVPYRYKMTLLDLMIQAGGLTRYADGDDAYLLRLVKGNVVKYELKIESLVEDGELEYNVDLFPGDIVYIPESWF